MGGGGGGTLSGKVHALMEFQRSGAYEKQNMTYFSLKQADMDTDARLTTGALTER